LDQLTTERGITFISSWALTLATDILMHIGITSLEGNDAAIISVLTACERLGTRQMTQLTNFVHFKKEEMSRTLNKDDDLDWISWIESQANYLMQQHE
jgi:hypothetical protein